MRCLIIHPGGIGDVLLAVPAIRQIRRRYGVDEMGVLALRQIGELLKEYDEVDEYFSLESAAMSDLLSGTEPPRSQFISWLRHCDRAVGWMTDEDGHLADALTAHGVRNIMIESAMTGTLSSRHQADRYLEIMGALDGPNDAAQIMRRTRRFKREELKPLSHDDEPRGRDIGIIHPGSGGRYKCCDPAVFMPVLQWMTNVKLSLVIVEGPADADYVRCLQSQWPGPLQIFSNCKLTMLADNMAGARLFVGHDSGITHLAAALGVPVVACFGPTDEARWAPRGKGVTTIRGAMCHCVNGDMARQCDERPCLKISPEILIAACEIMLRPAMLSQ